MINPERGVDLSDDLSSDKFKLVFRELKSLEILCREAPFPGISQNPVQIPNAMNSIYVNGSKVEYEQLSVTFKVDRDLHVFREIHDWIRDMNSPQTFDGTDRFKTGAPGDAGRKFTADASLFSLTNNFNPNVEFVFKNIFPVSVGTVGTGLGSSTMVTATANFQYDFYEIKERRK